MKHDMYFVGGSTCFTPSERQCLQLDSVGMFSTTFAWEALEICNIIVSIPELASLNRKLVVTDACAGCGGNTMSFLSDGRFALVHVVEIDRNRMNVLKQNLNFLTSVRSIKTEFELLCDDYTNCMLALQQDVVFLDPPWGGVKYREDHNIDLKIGGMSVAAIITALMQKGVLCVVVKAPKNFDLSRCKDELTHPENLQLISFAMWNLLTYTCRTKIHESLFDRLDKSANNSPHMPITYPSDTSFQIAEALDLQRFRAILNQMLEGHEPLHDRDNRHRVLSRFTESLPEDSKLKHLLTSQKDHEHEFQKKIRSLLNEPTYEALLVLQQSGIPAANSLIFASTATANSGHDSAPVAALRLLGVDKDLDIQCCSTATTLGVTGVSMVKPKNPAVYYDPCCKSEEWSHMSESIFKQMYKLSADAEWSGNEGILNKYTHIYHWGCISQNWQLNSLQRKVSSWKFMEHWNLLMTIAMMRHAVVTLQPGGQLCLKVRIFNCAETLGLVSLMSSLFERIQLLPNPRQLAAFVTFVGHNLTDDLTLRSQVSDILASCTDYQPSNIFLNAIQQTHPTCKQTMLTCQEIRRSMIDSKASIHTTYLACLRLVDLYFQHGRYEEFKREVMKLLENTLEAGHARHIFHELVNAARDMNHFETRMFGRVMASPWMQDNC